MQSDLVAKIQVPHTIPPAVVNMFHSLDDYITSFMMTRIARTRFNIVTLAAWDWLNVVLPLFPKLFRMYKWGMLTITACGVYTKFDVCKRMLSTDEFRDDYTEFMCCGDADHDVTALPLAKAALSLNGNIRMFKFVMAPTPRDIVQQWNVVSHRWLADDTTPMVNLVLIRPPPQAEVIAQCTTDVQDVDDAMEQETACSPVTVECA